MSQAKESMVISVKFALLEKNLTRQQINVSFVMDIGCRDKAQDAKILVVTRGHYISIRMEYLIQGSALISIKYLTELRKGVDS